MKPAQPTHGPIVPTPSTTRAKNLRDIGSRFRVDVVVTAPDRHLRPATFELTHENPRSATMTGTLHASSQRDLASGGVTRATTLAVHRTLTVDGEPAREVELVGDPAVTAIGLWCRDSAATSACSCTCMPSPRTAPSRRTAARCASCTRRRAAAPRCRGRGAPSQTTACRASPPAPAHPRRGDADDDAHDGRARACPQGPRRRR